MFDKENYGFSKDVKATFQKLEVTRRNCTNTWVLHCDLLIFYFDVGTSQPFCNRELVYFARVALQAKE